MTDPDGSSRPAGIEGADSTDGTDAEPPTTERLRLPPLPARRSDPPPAPVDRAGTDASVLDRPLDDVDLATRLSRPGLARSTRVLLLVLGAVVCLGLGALLGRATAPDTGPGSVPDVLGVVESVAPSGVGFPVLTVRSGDGTLTPLRTTSGTVVAVPRPNGPASLRPGQQVTVRAERGTDGAATAVRVDLPAG